MSKNIAILMKLVVAVFIVSAIEAINLRLLFLNFYSGNWFFALYFPISLGITVFGITLYFLTSGILWRRLLIAFFGSIFFTTVWFFIFVLATILITGVGGELIIVK